MIITSADKRRTVIIMVMIKYIAEADRQLSDATNFTKSQHYKICKKTSLKKQKT